jgi:hypothetical protein
MASMFNSFSPAAILLPHFDVTENTSHEEEEETHQTKPFLITNKAFILSLVNNVLMSCALLLYL